MPTSYLPVLAALGFAFLLGIVMLAMSWMAGNQSGGRVKRSTYESGEPLLDRSRKRISILFFLIAIDFVIFDVEIAFLLPWILVLEEGGWELFAAVMVFVLMIAVGFVYIWKKGGLDVAVRREEKLAGREVAG